MIYVYLLIWKFFRYKSFNTFDEASHYRVVIESFPIFIANFRKTVCKCNMYFVISPIFKVLFGRLFTRISFNILVTRLGTCIPTLPEFLICHILGILRALVEINNRCSLHNELKPLIAPFVTLTLSGNNSKANIFHEMARFRLV